MCVRVMWNKKDEGVSVYGNVKTQQNCYTTEYNQTSKVKECHDIKYGLARYTGNISTSKYTEEKAIELRYYTSYSSLQSNSQVDYLEATFILQTYHQLPHSSVGLKVE